jgi:hypothetical protein
LSAHVVDEAEIAPNYSFQLGMRSTAGPGAALSLVFRQCRSVVRTRSAARAFTCLLRYLYERTDPYAGGVVPVDTLALFRGGTVVLAPISLRLQVRKLQRQLEDEGFVVIDAPCAKLDAATGELVVLEPPLEVDHDAVDAMIRLAGQDPAAARVGPPEGSYPVTGWLFRGGPDEERSRLDRLHELTPIVRAPDQVGAQRALDAMSHVFDRGAKSVPVDIFDVASIRAAIRAAGA